MTAGHRKKRRQQKNVQTTHSGIQTRNQTTAPRSPEEDRVEIFQLMSGHAMMAPFLKDRWKWTDGDTCWRCERGRPSREHLFKERTAWTQETRELWKEVRVASGRRNDPSQDGK